MSNTLNVVKPVEPPEAVEAWLKQWPTPAEAAEADRQRAAERQASRLQGRAKPAPQKVDLNQKNEEAALKAKEEEARKAEETAALRAREEVVTLLADAKAAVETLPGSVPKAIFDGAGLLKSWEALKVAVDQNQPPATLTSPLNALIAKARAFGQHYATHKAGIDLALSCTFADKWGVLTKNAQAAVLAATAEDDVAFGQQLATIAGLGFTLEAAFADWDGIKAEVTRVTKGAEMAIGSLEKVVDLVGKLPARAAIEKLTVDVKKLVGASILADDERARIAAAAQTIDTWTNLMTGTFLPNHQMVGDLKAAFEAQGKNAKPFIDERSKLHTAVTNVASTAADISVAYNALLAKKGPWTARITTDKGTIATTLLLTNLGYADAATFAQELVGANRGAADILQGANISKATLDRLRVLLPSRSELLSTVAKLGSDAALMTYATDYLAFKVVSGANFMQLVQRNSVDLVQGGHKNPFRFYCRNCGMNEAEAALDVTWKGDITGKTFWGVVHVHYHGKTTTDPDVATYYHVKENSFAPSLGNAGTVTGVARNNIDAAIAPGQSI